MSYAEDRADFEYLESLAEVEDMVEIDAVVWSLMRNPTKREAAQMYRSAITLWFEEHGENYADAEDVLSIADRQGLCFYLNPVEPTP